MLRSKFTTLPGSPTVMFGPFPRGTVLRELFVSAVGRITSANLAANSFPLLVTIDVLRMFSRQFAVSVVGTEEGYQLLGVGEGLDGASARLEFPCTYQLNPDTNYDVVLPQVRVPLDVVVGEFPFLGLHIQGWINDTSFDVDVMLASHPPEGAGWPY